MRFLFLILFLTCFSALHAYNTVLPRVLIWPDRPSEGTQPDINPELLKAANWISVMLDAGGKVRSIPMVTVNALLASNITPETAARITGAHFILTLGTMHPERGPWIISISRRGAETGPEFRARLSAIHSMAPGTTVKDLSDIFRKDLLGSITGKPVNYAGVLIDVPSSLTNISIYAGGRFYMDSAGESRILLNIEPDVSNMIEARLPGGAVILTNHFYRLSSGERTNLVIPVPAVVRVLPVTNPLSYRHYRYELDETDVSPPFETNSYISKTHVLLVSDQYSAVVYLETNTVPSDGVMELTPQDSGAPPSILTILPVRNPDRDDQYRYTLDGLEMSPPLSQTNLYPGRIYRFQFSRNGSNLIDETFTAITGAEKTFSPVIPINYWFFRLFYRVDELTFGGGVEFYFNRYLHASFDLGASYFYSQTAARDLYYFFPVLSAGWYFFNSRTSDLRAAAGLSLRAAFALPQDSDEVSSPFISNRYVGLGAFATVSWKWFTFRPALYWDITNISVFHPSFTVGLEF